MSDETVVTGPHNPIPLGTRVQFTWTLHRRTSVSHDGGRRSVGRKTWTTEGYPGQPEPAPREGVVVGVRTLANGEMHYAGPEDPIIFRPDQHFTAYLVAFHLRRRPVLVLPAHMSPTEAAS